MGNYIGLKSCCGIASQQRHGRTVWIAPSSDPNRWHINGNTSYLQACLQPLHKVTISKYDIYDTDMHTYTQCTNGNVA